jgi:hypothetical protein
MNRVRMRKRTGRRLGARLPPLYAGRVLARFCAVLTVAAAALTARGGDSSEPTQGDLIGTDECSGRSDVLVEAIYERRG